MVKPAKNLMGAKLNGGWTVIERAKSSLSSTGGLNSVCYTVQHDDGTAGFMKALDLSQAGSALDFAAAIKLMTDAFYIERALLEKCIERRMDKIVRVIAGGEYRGSDGALPVPYLIFERASNGCPDLNFRFGSRLSTAVSLRMLHHLAIGLNQLHTNDIAHQDLKPSNALRIPGNVTKLGDLGSASERGNLQRHDCNFHAGRSDVRSS